jgi:serine/threonine protein kinase
MRLPGMSGRISSDPRKSSRVAGPEQRGVGLVVLGKYALTAYLGEGSNARVYLAYSRSDPDTAVVVKLVKEHLLQNPRFRQFFDGEVKSMASFSHPYAVRLLDASVDEPAGPCLVLEYIPGVTLEAVLNRYRRLPLERIGRLLGPLCHALQAAHSAKIVHRDLKPANLMVTQVDTEAESVKVMDFGFAGFSAKPHIQLAELTGKGEIFACGTPAYVSPEMVRGDAVDGRADLYAVGVMLFEMLTGRLPFDVASQDEMVRAHIATPPPRFTKIGINDVPDAVEQVVQIALSKYANERHATARDLAEHFGRAAGMNVWADAAPFYDPNAPEEEIVECTLADEGRPANPIDRFILSDRLEAMLPEKLAAAKLRGFLDDVGAQAVASEPGLIRVRIHMPSGFKEPAADPGKGTGSAILSWLSGSRVMYVPKGKEPIEVDLQMEKLDANRVAVLVTFRPLKWYIPDNVRQWKDRCEAVYTVLRRYLMAE